MAIDVTRGATAGAAQYPILRLNEAKDVITITKAAAFNLEMTGGDYKTVIIMSGTSGKTVTFYKGNGIQGAGDNLVVTLGSNPMAIVLDSGYFKNVLGDTSHEKDCIKIEPNASTVFTIVELPQ
jgi:hypothetical protein